MKPIAAALLAAFLAQTAFAQDKPTIPGPTGSPGPRTSIRKEPSSSARPLAATGAVTGWAPGADGIRQKGGQRLEIVLNAIEYGGGVDQLIPLVQASLHEVGIDLKIKAQARPPWYEDNYRCATHGPVMFLRATDSDGLYSLFHSSLVGQNFN